MIRVIFDLTILTLFSFLIRMIFLVLPSKGPDSDDVNHLWRTSHIKERVAFLRDYRVKDSIIEGYHASPPLASLIISLFPRRHWLFAGKILNILYDCVSVILSYCFSYVIFTRFYHPDAASRFALYTALLFSTMPVFFSFGSRLTSIGGRPLGLLLNLSYFILFGYAFIFNNIYLYPYILFLGILIIMASQFGLQNLIFTSLFLSICYLNPVPFLVALAILAIGYFLPFIGISKILKSKMEHYAWYYKNWSKHPLVCRRNDLSEIVRLPLYLFTEPKRFLIYIFKFFTPTIALLWVTPLFILMTLCIFRPEFYRTIMDDAHLRYFWFIIISSIAAFILTSIRKLLFLGEAERYFEYSALFTALLLVFYAAKNSVDAGLLLYLVLWQLSVVAANFIIFNPALVRNNLALTADRAADELSAFIKENIKASSIISIPTKFMYWLSFCAGGNANKFYFDFIYSDAQGLKYMDSDYAYYGFPRTDLEYFYEKYSVDIVIVAKRYFARFCSDWNVSYSFKDFDEIFQNGEYSIYRRKKP